MSGRVLKRPSACDASGLPKRQTIDPEVTKCDVVIAALFRAEGLSDGMKETLSGVVKTSMGVPKSERHPFQSSVVREIGEVLAGIRQKLETAVSDAQQMLETAAASKAIREAMVNDAQAALHRSEKAAEERMAELSRASDELEITTDALDGVQGSQLDGEDIVGEVLEKKSALESAFKEKFMPLVVKAASAADVKLLVDVGRRFRFDDALLAMAPASFSREPSERGDFDRSVFTHFECAFATSIADVGAKLKEDEPARLSLAAAVGAAAATQSTSMGKLDECVAAMEKSKTFQKACVVALTAAQNDLQNYFPELKIAGDALDEIKASFADFCKGPLTAFVSLEARTTHALQLAPGVQNEKIASEHDARQATYAGA